MLILNKRKKNAKALSNRLSGADLMRVLWALRNETDTHVWIILLKHLHSMLKSLAGTNILDQLKNFLKKLVQNITIEIGYEERTNEGNI